MFKAKKILILFGAAILALLSSCNFNNLQKKSATLVFDFTSVSGKVSTAARSTLSEVIEENETCYLDLKIQGGFEYNQTINLKETQIIQITDIPVGARITALADLYTLTINKDDATETKTLLYQGKSKGYTIIAGENNIQIPLKKYKPADDPSVDPDDEKDPAEDSNDPNNQSGGNGSEQEEDVITIWVKYVEGKQHDSTKDIFASTSNYVNNTATIQEDDGNDGKSQNTAFYYLQSAVEWIANNGDGNKDYEIKLVDYNDKPFDQGIYFKDSLNGRARSITLTSYDKTKTALQSCGAMSIYVRTRVPITLKNIKVSSKANSAADESPLILLIENSYAEVTLDEGTFFEGKDGYVSKYGSAIYLNSGEVYMKNDATITGFYTEYGGGAVCIKNGYFYMKDSSEISYCHTTARTTGGGAFYLINNGGPYVTSYLTIQDDAKIINCSTNFCGGAILIESGEFTMESGSITGCESTYNDGYGNGRGGAIYLSTSGKTNTTAILTGGTISGNTAGRQGSAIYIANSGGKTAKVILGEDIFIDPESNDIYISQPGDTIELSSDLKTTNPTAALITLYKNSSITAGVPVIESNDTEIIGNSYSKLQIRLEDSEAPNGYDSTSWRIDENGLLAANN